jgi:hypothetical protein
MHYGIPNAYSFGIMTLYRCMFHQFYCLDGVHSLYFFEISATEATLKYVKYAAYNIVFPIVNYLKLYRI